MRLRLKLDKEEAERNKASLRWWYVKYHPDCEIDGHDAPLNTSKSVVFTMTGAVTICAECYVRLGVQAWPVNKDPRLGGLLLALPLAPKMVDQQAELPFVYG